MDLRTEAWQLIATAARTNDADKMRRGNEKHKAAAKLLATPLPGDADQAKQPPDQR